MHDTEKYNDLELSILGCFLQKPELFKKTALENKHFKKHYKIFVFLKVVYQKFNTLDLTLLYSISKNKYRIVEYIEWITKHYGFPSLFETYERELIELYNQTKKDKWLVDKIYVLANELLARNISTTDFKNEIDNLYQEAEQIFEEVDY